MENLILFSTICVTFFSVCTCIDGDQGVQNAQIIVHNLDNVKLVKSFENESAVDLLIQCGGMQCDLMKEFCDTHVQVCRSCASWCATSGSKFCQRQCPGKQI